MFNLACLLHWFDGKEVERGVKLVPYMIVNKDGNIYILVKMRDGETKIFKILTIENGVFVDYK